MLGPCYPSDILTLDKIVAYLIASSSGSKDQNVPTIGEIQVNSHQVAISFGEHSIPSSKQEFKKLLRKLRLKQY